MTIERWGTSRGLIPWRLLRELEEPGRRKEKGEGWHPNP